jgi:hypothetical protein
MKLMTLRSFLLVRGSGEKEYGKCPTGCRHSHTKVGHSMLLANGETSSDTSQ